MNVVHTVGRSIDLYPKDKLDPAWTLDYAGRPKPYFHPVRTPAGQVLSLLEPADHPWHRGLWFTFKFINGDNFWEEKRPFGTQRVAAIPLISHPSPDDIRIEMTLDWIAPKRDERVIAEQRWFRSRATDGAIVIDWETELAAERDVTLDRTPYTTWGGYGGLSFRGSRSWRVDRFLFPGGSLDGRPAGQTGAWCEMSGPVDSGADHSAGLVMLDHPDNPRHPTPWYAGGAASGNFLNAALLFHEPMTLLQGQTLALRYRVLVHDGIWDAERLHAEHEHWLTEDTER